ncbi:MAG: peptidoglycan editing factor PgeF [Pseudomonadales bacterium]|nr:peptidoglycan editing factor PgeF [Pseudomonadales bacterium]
MSDQRFLNADWPAPRNVHAMVTTRSGGISESPYASFNLANHVGDNPLAVAGNRDLLREDLPPRISYQWLDQIHGADVITIESAGHKISADGLVSSESGVACCVLTADCLPMLFSNKQGTEIAAVHGGWRGLHGGILENAVNAMESDSADILVWLGPAIGPCHYEVGSEIKQKFLENSASESHIETIEQSFTASTKEGKFQFDLYQFAKLQLALLGVTEVYGGGQCTHCDDMTFYSYRRDGATGRMASIIYFTDESP